MPPAIPYGQDVTHATLTDTLGNRKLIRDLYKGWGDPDFWIPDPDYLKPGDIILTRPSPTRGKAIDRWFGRRTIDLQRRHCSRAYCDWTHVSFYIGDWMVAEANKSWPARTKVTHITKWINYDYKILRWRGSSPMDVNEAVRIALLDQIVNPRGYDTARAILAWFGIWTAPDSKRRVLCSEYVLDCLAAGQIMVPKQASSEEQEKLPEENRRYYLPAHFAEDSNFEHLEMQFSKVIKIPKGNNGKKS